MRDSRYERAGRVCLVVRTKPQQEKWAAHNVRQQGAEPWLPRISKAEVLFPSYLFVWTAGQWHFLRGTYGVLGPIMTGDAPAMLALSEVDRIRGMEGPDGYVSLPDWRRGRRLPRPGDPVEVTQGAFAGEVGLYVGMLPHERVRVLMEVLGRKTPVELRLDDLG